MDINEKQSLLTAGASDLELSKSYVNCAEIYRERNDFDNAIAYFKKALTIEKRMLGEFHVLAASSYLSIGDLLQKKNSYDEAQVMYENAAHIYDQEYGPDHPITTEARLKYLDNLANLK